MFFRMLLCCEEICYRTSSNLKLSQEREPFVDMDCDSQLEVLKKKKKNRLDILRVSSSYQIEGLLEKLQIKACPEEG